MYNSKNIPKFQIMALSSYCPLLVYWVLAYCQMEWTSNGLSTQVTLDWFVKGGLFN